MTRNELIDRLIDREGGTSDRAADRGGLTRWGISKKNHPGIDIATLTRDHAHEIYVQEYYVPAKVSRAPKRLRETYFDMVVNHGQGNAVKILQRAANGKRQFTARAALKVDGVLGPITLAAIMDLEVDRLRAYRMLFAAGIVFEDDSQEENWFGWYERIRSC